MYGNDIDETTTPVEAGLAWTIGKRRREEGKFPGDEIILNQLKNGTTRHRVGLLVTGPPAREGAEIVNEKDEHVGVVSSGTFSPTLGKPVAMGYVKSSASEMGRSLKTIVRDKAHDAVITKLPFVKNNYFRIQ